METKSIRTKITKQILDKMKDVQDSLDGVDDILSILANNVKIKTSLGYYSSVIGMILSNQKTKLRPKTLGIIKSIILKGHVQPSPFILVSFANNDYCLTTTSGPGTISLEKIIRPLKGQKVSPPTPDEALLIYGVLNVMALTMDASYTRNRNVYKLPDTFDTPKSVEEKTYLEHLKITDPYIDVYKYAVRSLNKALTGINRRMIYSRIVKPPVKILEFPPHAVRDYFFAIEPCNFIDTGEGTLWRLEEEPHGISTYISLMKNIGLCPDYYLLADFVISSGTDMYIPHESVISVFENFVKEI